ncbi:hypothetical protein SAY86_021545 [Trapa natans]|uniref:Protein kinase domain-containing protein n=1 Tax=Trapa natans TaxID=22666 RepID=A0AAN7M2A4_TRANT|nr:hypothetical protein SAY86_021545 [Trapa natans]
MVFPPFVFLAVLLICPYSHALTSDGLSLLALKAAVTDDPTGVMSSWAEADPTPCHWPGVVCSRGRVTSLFLPLKGLTGYIPSELGHLSFLRRLDLSGNDFSRLLPSHLFNATALVSLDLSNNSLSGPVPNQIKALKNLSHLDLSSNLFNGSLPEGLPELTGLAGTLNLSCNMFSGGIPESYGYFPVMVSLDLRHNNLTGKIPQVGSLLNQGPTAFSGNPSLCGFPLASPCPEAQDPRGFSNPEHPQNPRAAADSELDLPDGSRRKDPTSFIVGIISGIFATVGAVSVSIWAFRKKMAMKKRGTTKEKETTFEDINSMNAFDEEEHKGKFVVMDDEFTLELEDLLRASAYVVGKSRSGIMYKVVVSRGARVGPTVLAVRRLSEGDAAWRFKEFESEVEAIGRLCHPNIVPLRAYYFASDEKLLVSDFIRNGSLHAALHGELSKTSPLTWAARLKIAQGIARGLAFIHDHSPRKYVHGNIKSTKILLDEENQPLISGFGLTRLVSGISGFRTSSSKKHSFSGYHSVLSSGMELKSSSPSNVYLAPEARVCGSKFTPKCDVYSFGIVLMEILTGRTPDPRSDNDGKGLHSLVGKVFKEERPLSEIIDAGLLCEVHEKKQVMAIFHIALNCTEIDPELRPRMKVVSESIDQIKLL